MLESHAVASKFDRVELRCKVTGFGIVLVAWPDVEHLTAVERVKGRGMLESVAPRQRFNRQISYMLSFAAQVFAGQDRHGFLLPFCRAPARQTATANPAARVAVGRRDDDVKSRTSKALTMPHLQLLEHAMGIAWS